jgi:hypothetical protein
MDLVQNSIVFSLIKKEGTRNKKQKETKEDTIRIKSKHAKGIQN